MEPDETEQLEKEVEATQEVKRLRSKFLDNFFVAKHEQIFQAFKDCPIGDTETLESVHLMHKAMASLEAEINTVMNTGKMAELSLSRELDKTIQ